MEYNNTMNIIKISDVKGPETPSRPVTPIKEQIVDANIYSVVRKLLANGKMQWFSGDGEGSSEAWSDITDRNGDIVYYTYYTGQVKGTPPKKLYRLDVYVSPSSENKEAYAKGAMKLSFLANNQEIAKWSFAGDNIMEEPFFSGLAASFGIKDIKSPAAIEKQLQTYFNEYGLGKREEIRLTRRNKPSYESHCFNVEVYIVAAPQKTVN